MKRVLKRTTIRLFLPFALVSILYSVDVSDIQLTDAQADLIAQKVWKNEANGDLAHLIFWSEGEPFLSLGIAHFLWYSKENRDRYQEMFPKLVAYFSRHNVRLPKWLNAETACPWESRGQFLKAKSDKTQKYQDLYSLLVRTMPIQVDFIIERMQKSLPKMRETTKSTEEHEKIKSAYERIIYQSNGSISTRGVYAILDYVNFKGEGTSPAEQYKGEGWGLLQVLEAMNPLDENAILAFADAAKKVLSRRIENSPPENNETKWKKGWFRRIESYSD